MTVLSNKLKAYIGGPIFSREQISVMSTLEQTAIRLGFETFNPYEASRGIWKGRKPSECEPHERREVLINNIENMLDSDVLLAWVNGTADGRVDTGLAWEMGFTQALAILDYKGWKSFRRFPLTIGYLHAHMPLPASGLNLMLAGTMDAVVTSFAETQKALEKVQEMAGYEEELKSTLREMFDPERHSLHETVEIKP